MELEIAGKLFAKMFPTKERFREFLRWQEIEREKRIHAKELQNKIDKRRQEIELMSADFDDKDYDYLTDDCWEEVKG
ncbi:MAG: hypothetical protein GY841_04380 [FCB group bacterium]|nr:hypothetical protein [FCB group bacterium]